MSQCSGGSVNMGQYETSTGMKEMVNLWKDITTEAGITKLMYLLGKYSCKGFQNRV
jgi:L-asparaginase